MSKAKMEAVRALIGRQQYTEARAILRTIDSPDAIKWLNLIDDLKRSQASEQTRLREQSIIDAQRASRKAAFDAIRKLAGLIVLLVTATLLIAILIFFLATFSSGTQCGDGSYSSSTGRGTCSHHKGIK